MCDPPAPSYDEKLQRAYEKWCAKQPLNNPSMNFDEWKKWLADRYVKVTK